jgi:peptide/nickel transport system substrate-binding protein
MIFDNCLQLKQERKMLKEQENRSRISRRDFLRSVAIGLPLVLAACASAPSPSDQSVETSAVASDPTAPRRGGTLRLIETSDPRTFTPTRQLPWWMWGGIYDSLLRYTPSMEVYPHLAESFEISEDGRSISLKLRKDVKFHSGREFNGDDVVWLLETIKEPTAGALFRTFALSITEIEQPDLYSLVLHMEEPDAGMIDLLGNLYIPDREIYDDIDRMGAGTGPFEFVEFVPGDHIILKRNENYWGPKAHLDTIRIQIVGDAQAVTANLEANAADLVSVPLPDFIRLQDEGQYQTLKMVGGTGIRNVWLNMKQEPFDNKLVRQAMNYAINRERYVRTIMMEQSTPLWQPFADYHWAHFPELEGAYPFDLEKAKALLSEAGYENGFETTINAVSGDAFSIGLAEIMQSDLASIGVRVTIDAKDSPRWAEASDRGEFEINMHNYGRNNADPTLLFKGTVAWRPDENPSGIEDPEYLRLVNQQASVIDREQRRPLVKELIEYIQDMSFVIPVAGGVSAWAYDPKIEGFTMIPVGAVAYMEKIWFKD